MSRLRVRTPIKPESGRVVVTVDRDSHPRRGVTVEFGAHYSLARLSREDAGRLALALLGLRPSDAEAALSNLAGLADGSWDDDLGSVLADAATVLRLALGQDPEPEE